jgi:hypothetical protein
LVTGTDFFGFTSNVDTLGNVWRLFFDGHDDGTGFVIKSFGGIVVSNVFNGVTDDLLVVDGGFGGNFTKDHDHAGFGAGFTGNFGVWVLRQASVENGVGDTVTEFIGVAFIDGFGGEEKGIGFGFRHVGGVLCGSGGRRGVQNEKKEDWLDFCLAASEKHRVIDVVQGLGERHGVVVVKVWRTTPTRRKVVVFGRGGWGWGGLFFCGRARFLLGDCDSWPHNYGNEISSKLKQAMKFHKLQ